MALALLLAFPGGCERAARPPEAPAFVTAKTCGRCHPRELEAWRGSHHDLAMQPATDATVLARFDGTSLPGIGSDPASADHTVFYRRGDDFRVRTPGSDGAALDLHVRYTFGVDPLQQYLVEQEGGRLQALDVAWDARPAASGGQRWFSLHEGEPPAPGDVMHWSGPGYRWNTACADCHSTGIRKGYSFEDDRYRTTWSEIDVACEACHGPGSSHVAWAEARGEPGSGPSLPVALGSEVPVRWKMDPDRGIARREPARATHAEVEVCARCHARRSVLDEQAFGEAYLTSHLPALLEEGLYFADGQARDEVYVYGSFLQSAMYRAGVTCSDCHEPHSLGLRGTTETVCGRCHAAERFATPAHHGHATGSEAARCVTCHMPERTYMKIDARRDHRLGRPRPGLSEALGTPDPCLGCHPQRGAAWAEEAIEGWSRARASRRDRAGRVTPPATKRASPPFALALDAARRGLPGAAAELRRIAADAGLPAIVRATALLELSVTPAGAARAALLQAARDADPLLRFAASRGAGRLSRVERVGLLVPLLADPTRAVRIEVASALAHVPADSLSADERTRLDSALAEYLAVQRLHADRPEAHLNLGSLHERRGDPERAEAAYRNALRVGPWFLPVYVNLADLLRRQDREPEAERLLRAGLARAPEDADLRHALGLSLVRQRRPADALEALGRAARAQPGNPRYAYAHGVALHSFGQVDQALAVLSATHAAHPGDRATLEALISLHVERGALREARRYAKRLRSLLPGDPEVARRVAPLLDAPRPP